ncbi:MAG: HD domain-containing protein [Firmicutes bacterium]|nr:HD domain-containing protein [Bacillota bacterium]
MLKGKYNHITFEDIKSNEEINEYIEASNNVLGVKGFTEHGLRHVTYTAKTAKNILLELGFDFRLAELAAIAGWTHDIGNAVNRRHHGLVAADMLFTLLNKMGMPPNEISYIIGAVGNHEEEIGTPISPVAAALIVADKSDSHHSRVRAKENRVDPDDIHDRVNLAIKRNRLTVCKEKKRIRQMISMDKQSSVLEYLQIYMSRVLITEKAAQFLGCSFELMINGMIINQKKKAIECDLETDEKVVSEE